MKGLLLITLWLLFALCTSCGSTQQRKYEPKQKTLQEKMHSCIDFYMTKHGTSAEDSVKLCQSIYRR